MQKFTVSLRIYLKEGIGIFEKPSRPAIKKIRDRSKLSHEQNCQSLPSAFRIQLSIQPTDFQLNFFHTLIAINITQ